MKILTIETFIPSSDELSEALTQGKSKENDTLLRIVYRFSIKPQK